MANSNKKFMRAVRQLVEKALEEHTFLFSSPKQIALPLDWDSLSGKVRKAIKAFAHRCREQASDAKKCQVKRFSLSDRGDTVLNFLPLPVPTVDVLTDDSNVRYTGALLLWPDRLLLSLQQVQTGKNTGILAGINLSGKELKLVHKVLDLTGQRIWQYSIVIDRHSHARSNIRLATSILSAPPADRLANAVNSLPLPHLFGAVHAVLATPMPLLEEDCKPCYFPALRLDEDNDTVREMQLEELRRALGGLAFARDRSGGGPLLPELALQDAASIRTLGQVKGLPVLAVVDRDPVQRDLTDAMQRAHSELIATGFAKHPLRTLPLLTGTALPAGNVILALDWPVFTAANPDDLAVLRQAFGAMLRDPQGVADRLNHAVRRMTLYGRPYAEVYLETATAVLDKRLFGNTAQSGTLVWRVDEMIARHHVHQAEQQRRFDRALACLPGLLADPDIVAENVKTLREQGGLGFRYTTKDGGLYAAFELGEDFSALLKKLGLCADDGIAFRELLLRHGSISEMSRNVRGRSGNSCSHVLITLE